MRLMVSESMMQAHGSRTAESSHLDLQIEYRGRHGHDDIGSHTRMHTHKKEKKGKGKSVEGKVHLT